MEVFDKGEAHHGCHSFFLFLLPGNLKLEQDAKICNLRQEFDARARDLQAHSAQKMKMVREEMERQTRQEISVFVKNSVFG